MLVNLFVSIIVWGQILSFIILIESPLDLKNAIVLTKFTQ